MKKLLYLFFSLALAESLYAQESTEDTPVEEAQQFDNQGNVEARRRIAMIVHGLACPCCAKGISAALEKRSEIADFHIDLKSGTISIGLNSEKDIANSDLINIMKSNGISTSEEEISRNWKE